jgi:hypothetical protein
MSADRPNAVDELIAFVQDTMATAGPGRWGVELPDGTEPFEKRLNELSVGAFAACAEAGVSLEVLQAVPTDSGRPPYGPMKVPLCYGRGWCLGPPRRPCWLVYIDNPEWLLAMRGLAAALDARTQPKKRGPGKRSRSPLLEARDKWLYEQCCDTSLTYEKIKGELRRCHQNKAWTMLASIQGIRNAATNYAARHNLAPPPPRQEK